MNVPGRLARKRRTADEGRYVCRRCGAAFDDGSVVVCPRCPGFVSKRES